MSSEEGTIHRAEGGDGRTPETLWRISRNDMQYFMQSIAKWLFVYY